MAKNDFTIIPHKGLGKLVFGDTDDIIFSLEPIYGKIINIDRTGDPSYWEEKIQEEKNIEEKERYINILKAMRKFDYVLITYYYGNKIFACYKNNKLVEIGANDQSIDLYFDDINIFKDDPKEVITKIAKKLNECPYIDGQQIYFRNAAITFSCFIEGVEDGKVLWGENGSEFTEEKSMAFSTGIDISDNEYKTFFQYNVFK